MYNFVMSTVISIYPSTVTGNWVRAKYVHIEVVPRRSLILHLELNVNSILPKGSFDK